MKKILVLHVGAEMYGADKVLFDLLRSLDKNKYEPYVILPEEGTLVDALKKENIKVEVIPYPIIRRKYFNIKGVFSYIINYFKYSKKLVKIAKRENIDIIHNNTSAVLEGSYVSRKLNIPQIWVVHEIIQNPKLVFNFLSFIIAKFSTKTIVVSNAVKSHLKSTGYFKNKDIKVIHNGVDITRFNQNNNCNYLYKEWNIPKNAKIIGMIGRINSWKGQSDFLKSANIIMKRYKNVYTIFVGGTFDGEEWRKQELEVQINKSKYKKRIILTDYRIDTECIHKLFDIFVLPSTNPDPLPTVVLEAMATGKPIVGYAHGGICEMIEDNVNGLLAEPCNPKELATKIDKLLNNPKLLKQMGNESLERLNNLFSLQNYIDSFTKEYESI